MPLQLIICVYVQADLQYDSEAQSSHLQEVLNTCLEVETGLEASKTLLYCVVLNDLRQLLLM